MPRNPWQLTEQPIPFPVMGIDLQRAYLLQNNASCIDARNMRSFDPRTDRARGGSRSGMEYAFDGVADAADNPIQHITQFTTADSVVPSLVHGQLLFALTAANGFGLLDNDGTAIWTDGAETDFSFACSCWDDDNKVYIATVNATTGAVHLFRNDLDGNTSWTQNTLTVATGSVRRLAGMCVIGDYLYVARRMGSAPLGIITKILKKTGAITTANWATATTFLDLLFSDNSINCLGKVGVSLGVEVIARATHGGFYKFTTTSTTVPPAQTVFKAHLAKSASVRSTTARSAVTSDGTTFFYVIASESASQVRKLDLSGNEVWAAPPAAVANGLYYDPSNGFLLSVHATSPSLIRHNLETGATQSSADPETVTNYSWIDGEGRGFYTLYRDSVASGDVLGINSTFTTVWGPSTKANTIHSGASVNKGVFQAAPIAGNRIIRKFLVSNGTLYHFDEDGPTAVDDGDAWDNAAPQIFSAQNGDRLFFVDGSTYKYYDGADHTVKPWVITEGVSLPYDAYQHPAKLICTWNGRTVLALGQNYFMSKQYNPLDWDYSPDQPSAVMAFAGNPSLAGLVGSKIACLVPYTDEILLFGCDHEIYQMAGDPGAGGGLSLFSQGVGMAFGQSYAFDPEGLFYFMGGDGRIYKMVPGSPPIPASQQIDVLFSAVDLSTSVVCMTWDMERQGLHVWITPVDLALAGSKFFWEKRVNAWWRDEYADKGHYPFATFTFDGDAPQDRVVFVGGRDGKVRKLATAATTDTLEDIESYVTIGPFKSQQLDDVFLDKVQAILGNDAGDVAWEVYSGRSAEDALAKITADTPDCEGTLAGGASRTIAVRKTGFVFYIKLASSEAWAMERLVAAYRTQGAVRRWG